MLPQAPGNSVQFQPFRLYPVIYQVIFGLVAGDNDLQFDAFTDLLLDRGGMSLKSCKYTGLACWKVTDTNTANIVLSSYIIMSQ